MKLKEPNSDCGTMSKASSQRMDRGDWVPLETYCDFYPLSGSKKTPILQSSPNIHDELPLDYRRISGGQVKARLPQELVRLVPLYQKESFLLPLTYSYL